MNLRNTRIFLTSVLAIAMCSAALPSIAGPLPGSKVIGTDPAGDWGDVPALAPVGDALGQDILEASVAKPDPATLRFTLTFTNLPDTDPGDTGLYLWGFKIPKGERTLMSCGTAGLRDCEDSTNFAVLGDCETNDHPILGSARPEIDCERLGEVAAEIDREANAISMDVPLSLIEARRGQVLRMKSRWVVAASPAFLIAVYGDSNGNSFGTYLNFDVLEVERNYRIPR